MSNPGKQALDKHNPGSRPRVVLVNRCFLVDEEGRFLLLQRSADDRHDPNLWEVPGGKLDEGQDLHQALARETQEETGYIIEDVSRLVFTQSEVISGGPYDGLPYVALFSVARIARGELSLSEEHQDAVWVSYDEARDYELKLGMDEALQAMRQNL